MKCADVVFGETLPVNKDGLAVWKGNVKCTMACQLPRKLQKAFLTKAEFILQTLKQTTFKKTKPCMVWKPF